MPAGEGALSDGGGDTAARCKDMSGTLPKCSFHAQGFQNGLGGCAILPDADLVIRYLEHDVPSSLVRRHYHEEYELHLICASSGKVFVGDYIGQFAPGHLVLTGPRVPHNWVSLDTPAEGVKLRDMVIKFGHAPLEQMAGVIPELKTIMPLLNRASYGVEFFDLTEQARQRFIRIRDSSGLPRFIEFLSLLGELAESSNYQLLSTVPMQSTDDDDAPPNPLLRSG